MDLWCQQFQKDMKETESPGHIQGAQWLAERMGGRGTSHSVLLDPWNRKPPEQIANSKISSSCKRHLREGGCEWRSLAGGSLTAGWGPAVCVHVPAEGEDLKHNCFQQNTASLCN